MPPIERVRRAALFRIGLGEGFDGPQQQDEDDDAEKKGHGYFSCSISRTAPAPCRAWRSASAFIPPAA